MNKCIKYIISSLPIVCGVVLTTSCKSNADKFTFHNVNEIENYLSSHISPISGDFRGKDQYDSEMLTWLNKHTTIQNWINCFLWLDVYNYEENQAGFQQITLKISEKSATYHFLNTPEDDDPEHLKSYEIQIYRNANVKFHFKCSITLNNGDAILANDSDLTPYCAAEGNLLDDLNSKFFAFSEDHPVIDDGQPIQLGYWKNDVINLHLPTYDVE